MTAAFANQLFRILSAVVMILFILCMTTVMADHNIIRIENGIYSVRYQSDHPDTFIRDIERMFQIRIVGSYPDTVEKIDISLSAESVENLLKKCMASVNMKSYAFKYHNARLTTLYLVPSSGEDIDLFAASSETTPDPPGAIGVRVTSIADDVNMQMVNLQTGDIIVEYDHIPISGGPLELSRRMDERSGSQLIQIRFFRDKIPITAFVPGGYLNAGLKSEPL